MSPMQRIARDAMRQVPPWAQARETGVAPAMALACSHETWMTLPQMRRALVALVGKGEVVRVGRDLYALPEWPAARPSADGLA